MWETNKSLLFEILGKMIPAAISGLNCDFQCNTPTGCLHVYVFVSRENLQCNNLMRLQAISMQR